MQLSVEERERICSPFPKVQPNKRKTDAERHEMVQAMDRALLPLVMAQRAGLHQAFVLGESLIQCKEQKLHGLYGYRHPVEFFNARYFGKEPRRRTSEQEKAGDEADFVQRLDKRIPKARVQPGQKLGRTQAEKYMAIYRGLPASWIREADGTVGVEAAYEVAQTPELGKRILFEAARLGASPSALSRGRDVVETLAEAVAQGGTQPGAETVYQQVHAAMVPPPPKVETKPENAKEVVGWAKGNVQIVALLEHFKAHFGAESLAKLTADELRDLQDQVEDEILPMVYAAGELAQLLRPFLSPGAPDGGGGGDKGNGGNGPPPSGGSTTTGNAPSQSSNTTASLTISEEKPAEKPEPKPNPLDELPEVAPRPEQLSFSQLDLAVPYPSPTFYWDVTDDQVILLKFIVAASQMKWLFVNIYLSIQHEPIDAHSITPRLKYWARERMLEYIAVYRLVAKAMKPFFEPITTAIKAQVTQERPREDFFVILPDTEGPYLPVDWVSVDVIDPIDDPDPNPNERQVWQMMALARYLIDNVPDWVTQFITKPFNKRDVNLLYTLSHFLERAYLDANDVVFTFEEAAEYGRKLEAKRIAERAGTEARLAEGNGRIVVVGDNKVPAQFTKFALTSEFQPVAVSHECGQFAIGLGAQGKGKSQIAKLMMEGIHVPIRGLSVMKRRGIAIALVNDFKKGREPQFIGAFEPNRSQEQRNYLYEYYGASFGNSAIRRAHVLCFPESVADIQHNFPDLIEKGLLIHPIQIHPTELGAFGYSLFLRHGAELGGGKQQHQSLLDNLVTLYGADAEPLILCKEIEEMGLPGITKKTLITSLRLVSKLVSKQSHQIDILRDGAPVFIFTDDKYFSPDLVLALQVLLMHILGQPLRNGADPLRWFFIEELMRLLRSGAVMEHLKIVAAEIRHRPISYYLALQNLKGLDPSLLSLATLILQFFTSSPAEFRNVKDHYHMFSSVSYHDEIATLKTGEAMLGMHQSNHPSRMSRAFKVWVRPCAFFAGGETVRVT